jgi:hypothetical protein
MIGGRAFRRWLFGRVRLAVVLLAMPLLLAGCSAITGFPEDPEDDTAQIAALRPWFNPSAEVAYNAIPVSDAAQRRAMRDQIVFNRIRLLDVMFGRLERQLWGFGTATALGSDLVALTLGGLAATTGNGATASALAAASAGVVAGQAALSKDLFYKEALPAVLAQMEANRDVVKAAIIDALLRKTDAEFGLPQALMAVQSLKTAGDVPHALGAITQTATANKEAAQQALVTAQYQAVLVPQAVNDRAKVLGNKLVSLARAGNTQTLAAVATAMGLHPAAGADATGLLELIRPQLLSRRTASDFDALAQQLTPILGAESTWSQ